MKLLTFTKAILLIACIGLIFIIFSTCAKAAPAMSQSKDVREFYEDMLVWKTNDRFIPPYEHPDYPYNCRNLYYHRDLVKLHYKHLELFVEDMLKERAKYTSNETIERRDIIAANYVQSYTFLCAPYEDAQQAAERKIAAERAWWIAEMIVNKEPIIIGD